MSKKTSKHQVKPKKREQSALSRVLASSNWQRVILDRFFSDLSAGDIYNSLKSIAGHRHFKQAIQLPRQDYKNFYLRMTPNATLEKNIAWCLGLLETHKESVQYFLEKESEVVDSLLDGNQERLIGTLNDIDKTCGISMWSIGLRGSALAMAGMVDEKRNLHSEINERGNNNGFFKAVARLVANRYEDSDMLSSNSGFFEQKVKRGFSGETLHFLMYKVIPYNFEFEYDFSHIINVEKNSSPIDILKSLLDMVVYSISTSGSPIYKNESRVVIRQLARTFNSPSLNGLANVFGIATDWSFEKSDYNVLDEYTRGNYQDVCALIQDDLILCRKFALFELWARASSRTKFSTQGFIGKILAATVSMMLKDDDYEKSVSFLLLHCNAFGMLPWFKELQHLVTRETRFISTDRNLGIELASISLSGVCSPLKVRCMPESLRQTYIVKMRDTMPNSVVVRLHDYAWNTAGTNPDAFELESVDGLRAKKYCAKSLIQSGNNTEAIPLLEQLLKVDDRAISFEACRLLINSYIATGHLEAAVNLYVQAVMTNPHLLRTFDSRLVSSVCEGLASLSKSISIPIALSFHYRFIDDAYDAALRYSFERFLNNNGFQSPLELFGTTAICQKLCLYFLEHICVPDVMKLYLFFDNAKAIEECRIEICKRLIEKRHSVESMVSEVKERTRRQVLLEATKHVENSRIYSDTDSFMTSSEYRLLYERFVKFRLQNYDDYDDESGLADLYGTLKNDPLIMSHAYTMHVQDIVLNEKNAAFLKLCKIARDEFTFGVKGLSGHLSTRIRHGHFPNTLRKCVSTEGLLSSKPKSSSGYKRNAVWPDRISAISDHAAIIADKVLAEFSSKYDSLINEVNDRWFQINVFDQEMTGLDKGSLTESALFNYSITAFESYCIQRRLPETAEYNDFVKIVIQWLWDRTEQNLEKIRDKISLDFRSHSHRLLDDLESEMFKIAGASDVFEEFSTSVGRARTSLASAIDTVVGWFRRSQGLTVPKFDLDIAVTIARRSADAEIDHIDSSNIEFQGRTLSYLVDILYVLLENCVTKSNLPKGELNIKTRLERGTDGATLSVINNCAPVDDVAAANESLEYYRNSYGKETFALKAAQGEGGSGFFKVWKSLAKDLGLAHEIFFGYEGPDSFVVSIVISNAELEKVIFHENIDC